MRGMSFKERKASPAKSLDMKRSWSITVNWMQAPAWRHCAADTELKGNEYETWRVYTK